MALRRDYSLTKDVVFEENEDLVFSLYDRYETTYVQGQYYKGMLKEYITFYKGICGKGENIDKLFDLLYQYACMSIADPNYTFVDEADNLRDSFYGLTEYNKILDVVNEELGRTIDGWLASASPASANPQQRKQELALIGQVEQILNRRCFIYESILLINAMMQGSLPEGYPQEEKQQDSSYGFVNLPIMTHIPCIDDFDETELMYSPLMQVLYNMVSLNSYIPIIMCHDYDNGNVCVRLWQKEQDEYIPVYTSVSKADIYVNKIGYSNQKTIWPGIIEAAFEKSGLPQTKEEIVEAILGPVTSEYDMTFLCGANIRPKEDWSRELTEAVRAYIKCFYDIYSMFLLTNSLASEDELPYVKLQYGLKECMEIISCCVGQTLAYAQDAVKGLSELLSEYRDSVESKKSSPIVKKRLSVCDTADKLIDLYNCDSEFHLRPHIYFEISLAEKIIKQILSSQGKPVTKENINGKIKAVITDSVFRKEVSKMNIHALKNANEKLADSVLAKMERREK